MLYDSTKKNKSILFDWLASLIRKWAIHVVLMKSVNSVNNKQRRVYCLEDYNDKTTAK